MKDWKIFRGNGPPHDEIVNLPDPPPWRFAKPSAKVLPARGKDEFREAACRTVPAHKSDGASGERSPVSPASAAADREAGQREIDADQ